ncbi:MAG: bifunctional transaldolase/phosoglucose isomerase [Elusimicrobia bacterium]|nr:bifunctional transaldolase/phosoglucose isomerase [Elusimicrobiota bacterium]
MNPLRELGRFGVSVWYDNISRGLLVSGELARKAELWGLKGVTSNPTIFEKAIGSSNDYDPAIQEMTRGTRSPQEMFETMAVEDIRAAADLFKPVYEESEGQDGYVSIELAPHLARQAEASHKEALRLHRLVGRPNVMIKIPGTEEGLLAVEKAIADGVPVNITLLFSQERYAKTLAAYLRGLEKRLAQKKDLSKVASVASFFVSRIDTAADKRLAALGTPEARALSGKAAIANAKLAYQIYKRQIASERFAVLKRAGAQVQRLLWASTGTKNPNYRDVLYVEELIGADTVNTMPPATLEAFYDHGACRPSLEEDPLEAREQWEGLGKLGVDMAQICRDLEEEGLKAFSKSFETLMGQISAKRELLKAEVQAEGAGLDSLAKAQFSSRLWQKDPTLWKTDKAHQKAIRNSLGWLTLPDSMSGALGPIRNCAAEIVKEGFETAVVLGMGGSSLVCEVFRTAFPRGKGFPKLEILDSTHPKAVAGLESRLNLKRALFVISSKSGSTIEPGCLLDYFYDRVSKLSGDRAGRQFMAITDPGTSLENLAVKLRFRKTCLNPPDVGGRFSALSYFGLVPAALMGIDIERLLGRARDLAKKLSPAKATEENLALRLGAALAAHAAKGQDKLTLCLPPGLEPFGLWLEQLIAESTGKEGQGIVPVVGEAPAKNDSYGGDRLFVHVSLDAAAGDLPLQGKMLALEKAGRPVLTLKMADVYDLGAQFLLWEIATAAAGHLMGVNPFDQPDVQSAKDQTRKLLSSLKKGALPKESPTWRWGGVSAWADAPLAEAWTDSSPPLSEVLAKHLGRLNSGDYAALLSFLDPESQRRSLEGLRAQISALTSAPVCLEHGPRYLHSTGQLHKGGPSKGVFIMICEARPAALEIPGRPYHFGTLISAQARGDFEALKKAGRRVLLLALESIAAGDLSSVANALKIKTRPT